ncbi:glycosyltransferase family 39 protein, partial [Candidatus Roizmanbacteria bacterium]|nr:glycosyltransferase family 39 protein [Candidatus Roizmanbacteria bacterium]
MRLRIWNIVANNKLFLTLLIPAIFIRFFRLYDFATFLGDQGRDAIIIKRIATLEHLPAIGAPSSVGGFFLGPFYYYLVAPFLLIFNFSPEGLAFGVALIYLVGIIFCFYLIKREINYPSAIFFTILFAYSGLLIDFARFSWNPNLLPLVSFLSLYFLYKTLKHKQTVIFPALFGAFLSFSIQLHYLAIFLSIPILVILGHELIKQKKRSSLIQKIIFSVLSFFVFSSPLLIFDLKHEFVNSRTVIRFFSEKNIVSNSSFFAKIMETNSQFYFFFFGTHLNNSLALIITISLTAVTLMINRSKKFNLVTINLLNFLLYIFCFSLLNTFRLVHYYGSLYLSFSLLITNLLAYFFKGKILRIFITVFLFMYIIFNVSKFKYLFGDSIRQIQNAEIVADTILKTDPKQPYQIIAT